MITIISKDKINLVKIPDNTLVVDFTRLDTPPFNQLSQYYSWKDIPVPYSPNFKGNSLHSIWEGLKIFEHSDIDRNFISSSSRDRRTEGKNGQLIGFKRGIYGEYIFKEEEARMRILIKTYKWILENKAYKLVLYMRYFSKHNNIIFIDYNCNNLVNDISTPLSFAFLVKSYIEGEFPYDDIVNIETQYKHYCGKRIISWETKEKVFKKIPPISENNYDTVIDFDY